MANRSRPTLQKREREKAERSASARRNSGARTPRSADPTTARVRAGEDPDLAGITPGPQPLADWQIDETPSRKTPSRSPDDVEYLIKQYPLEQGALEIQYLEEFFGEFPRKKAAAEIVGAARGPGAPAADGRGAAPGTTPATSSRCPTRSMHEIRADETEPKLRDLVARLRDCVVFDGRKVLYTWIGGTRRDWRGQGHFRALTEESEAWAFACGYDEVVVKTKNKFYEMREHARQAAVRGHQVRARTRATTPSRRCT